MGNGEKYGGEEEERGRKRKKEEVSLNEGMILEWRGPGRIKRKLKYTGRKAK